MNYQTVILVTAVIIGIYFLQILLSNKSGSEEAVQKDISKIQGINWNFVALKYCYGISNRTYMVFVTDNMICGAKVRGPLPAPMYMTERWKDPYFFPRPEFVEKYSNVNPESKAFKKINNSNFQILREEIKGITFSTEKKWGMGTVPYSGRLFINLNKGSKIELILLGVQNGIALRDRLLNSGFGKALLPKNS